MVEKQILKNLSDHLYGSFFPPFFLFFSFFFLVFFFSLGQAFSMGSSLLSGIAPGMGFCI